ncbi:MAG: UDP-N-acetylglucosamine 2-epimerase [Flavobacteriaceae bacterium]|nr:UDP-N-acetylglucosamine 2-epimerase [Flavobacteriaceae bacterium]
MKRKIVFLTGTRADFGKLKPLIQILQNDASFETHLFVTGMHLIPLYGYTLIEIQKSGFKNIHTFENTTCETTMELTLAKTIEGFSSFVKILQPDLIVVHGDRLEALAGAIVGSFNNCLVAHIEGGELSGTIDELIRHSVSKLSHIHFVANEEAKKRLIQMGEIKESIAVIGSPDIDIMFSNQLPSLNEVKSYYEISYETFGIVLFHPVTTEIENLKEEAQTFVKGLIESNKEMVVIYPNNDLGSSIILEAYEKLKYLDKFRLIPSMRFEYFLTLLKNADFIIGNSSAGVREAPYYGVPTINVGSRQLNRINLTSIQNIECEIEAILNSIKLINEVKKTNLKSFGKGNSAELFINILNKNEIWNINHQKQFKAN